MLGKIIGIGIGILFTTTITAEEIVRVGLSEFPPNRRPQSSPKRDGTSWCVTTFMVINRNPIINSTFW